MRGTDSSMSVVPSRADSVGVRLVGSGRSSKSYAMDGWSSNRMAPVLPEGTVSSSFTPSWASMACLASAMMLVVPAPSCLTRLSGS